MQVTVKQTIYLRDSCGSSLHHSFHTLNNKQAQKLVSVYSGKATQLQATLNHWTADKPSRTCSVMTQCKKTSSNTVTGFYVLVRETFS